MGWSVCPDLAVYARTATEKYRDTTKDPREIGQEIDVGNIVEGSVRMYGERFTIHVQLIQTKTGYHLWSDVFDGMLSDTIFIVQRRIAEKVAEELNAVITPFEKQQIQKVPTYNFAAYDNYLEGTQFLRKYYNMNYIEDREMAEKRYRESLEIDPKFSMGYAGLADIYLYEEVLDSLIYYADKTLEYDPNNSRGYMHTGHYYRQKANVNQALESFEKALELDSNFAKHYVNLGMLYCINKKDYSTGLQYFKMGEERLIKQKDRSADLYNWMGNAFLAIGDFKKARQHYEISFEEEPYCYCLQNYCVVLGVETNWEIALDMADSLCNNQSCEQFCYGFKSFAYYLSGDYSQAEAHQIHYIDASSSPSAIDSAFLAFIYNELGREQEAFTLLKSSRNSLEKQLKEQESWMANFTLSQICAVLDENEEALKYLSNVLVLGFGDYWDVGNAWFDLIELLPTYAKIRNNPEFKAIVKRARDEKAAIRAQVQEMVESGELDL
jgi:tetratricopeptide (TPR) repeat protein